MDHGFNDRVDKVFGSISSSSSSTPWSLTDAQLERRGWNRHKTDDDEIAVCQFQTKSPDNDWEIRSSIGLDSTLDNEKEGDAYDKMAQGRENCLYMKDVTYLNSHHVLPHAAKTEPMLKSILKRKSYEEVSKPAKRVSFHSTCKNVVDATNPDLPENGPGVPDYILNPSKYTRYTFDDSSHYVNNEEEFLEGSSKHDGGELPRSLVFIPRKKKHGKQSACPTIGFAAVKVQQGEANEMQEDDICTKARCHKPVRQYRSKMEEYDDVS
ncbi:hypothetical protein L1987_57791 [Smallanthus sonchifolius]|uniref:Uncharacterized protein n=1 Tax=Smallanthus sonchifolius TaxID=185202 RepID=A0ACB9DEL2_9ASTR|nr:hypothetical protein L1987_57791 [Smallanthus sonchifolius]